MAKKKSDILMEVEGRETADGKFVISTEKNQGYKIWITLIIVIGLIIISSIFAVTAILNSRNDFAGGIDGTIDCNSGNLGLDYQSTYNNTLYTKDSFSFKNGTNTDVYNYLEGGFVPKILNIKGINNMSCKVNAKLNLNTSTSNLNTILLLKLLGVMNNK